MTDNKALELFEAIVLEKILNGSETPIDPTEKEIMIQSIHEQFSEINLTTLENYVKALNADVSQSPPENKNETIVNLTITSGKAVIVFDEFSEIFKNFMPPISTVGLYRDAKVRETALSDNVAGIMVGSDTTVNIVDNSSGFELEDMTYTNSGRVPKFTKYTDYAFAYVLDYDKYVSLTGDVSKNVFAIDVPNGDYNLTIYSTIDYFFADDAVGKFPCIAKLELTSHMA